jgi:fatty-acid desaturase
MAFLDPVLQPPSYHREDKSINQLWPGFVAGEWHNNRHLYPKSASSGFTGYQLGLAWQCIRLMHCLGAVSSYKITKTLLYPSIKPDNN